MSQGATIQELITSIQRLRADMPDYNPNDPSTKEKINYYEGAIHNLILNVKDIVGFETFAQALKFVDTEIRNAA